MVTLQLLKPAVAWTSALLPNIISDSLLLHDPEHTESHETSRKYCLVDLHKDFFTQTQNGCLKIGFDLDYITFDSTILRLQLKEKNVIFYYYSRLSYL